MAYAFHRARRQKERLAPQALALPTPLTVEQHRHGRDRQMAESQGLVLHHLNLTVRFLQGYRYLDRCGEALIRLEERLHEGWIPAEVSPKSGSLKNDTLGMVATFNSESLNVQQTEFVDPEHFIDQSCRAFDVICNIFEISRINA